jgi:hypothetical protein
MALLVLFVIFTTVTVCCGLNEWSAMTDYKDRYPKNSKE